MLDYFVFPANFEDVEQEFQNRHSVQCFQIDINEKQIINELKKIDSSIFQNYEDICKHQCFDFLYNLIKGYGQNIQFKSMKVLEKLSETMHHIGTIILKQCTRMANQDMLQSLRVSYKMTMFLILFLVTVVTKSKQKSSQADILADAINKQMKKKKTKNSNEVQFSRTVFQNLKMIIELLKDTLSIDYKVLWQRKQVDQQLFKKYTDVCVKVLESSIAKDQENINYIFYILEVIIREKPELFMNIQRVLINLVYESQMTQILVQFFSRASSPQLQRLCTETIICVVVYLVQKNLSSEASSIKNTKQFLSKLSERIPKMFYNNLSCFIRLYEHDSYVLRNAISDILMNILRFVFNNEQKQADDSMNKAQEKFINTLLQRIYDKSSFCRWHALGIFNVLAVEKAVPKKYLVMFLKAGVDRIKDVSVNTRKKALQLINTIIEDVWPEEKQLNSANNIQQQKIMVSMNKQAAESQYQIVSQLLEQLQQKQEEQKEQNEDFYQNLQKLQNEEKLLGRTIKEYESKQAALLEEQQIVKLINDVLSKVKILLSSKTDTDVLQTIRLFIKFYRRNLEYCRECLPNIRLLVFSRQKKIKDEVLMTFTQLHLVGRTVEEVANQLIGLFTEATPQDKSALEQILQIIISQSLAKNIAVIKPSVFSYLWSDFIRFQRNDSNQNEKRAILTILRLAYSRDPLMIRQQIVESFLNILKKYIAKCEPDFYILREIIRILMVQPGTCRPVESNIRNFLLAIMCVLVNSQQCRSSQWYSSCQFLLTCIYKMSTNPEKLSQIFLKKLHDNLVRQSRSSSTSVSHFIFALSHNCLKMLIHLDCLQSKIKSMKIKEDNEKAKNINQDSLEEEEQLDKVVGGVQAELQAKISEIQRLSQQILADPFISRWVKVVETIANGLQTGSQLEIIAILGYCKFMCISSQYCEANFSNLLKILNKVKIDSVIKNNIIIAIGDLLHRFPNIVEPYSPYLYQNLHDKDNRVRKTTLTVLTHLALNDMIKVKGDICDIAMLFQDPDPQIESLVKQFFNQVNRKDPKYLFNIIPEALHRFSDQSNFRGDQKTFIVFFENITPLMEKDKYSESLITKLCERLSTSLNILQVKNAAYCLSELNMNEKGLRKLIQCFPDFKKTLETPDVLNYFKNLITKLKKSNKGDFKSLVEELEQKVLHSNQDMFNADEIKKRNQRNQKKQPRKKNQNKKSGETQNSNSRKKQSSRGRGRKKVQQQISQQNQMDIEDDSQEYNSRKLDADAARIIQRIRPSRNASRRPIIVEQSEIESESQYIEDEDE